MSKRPNLCGLEYLLEQGNNIQLTGREYEEKTGAALPKDKNYIISRSALARWAKENGYKIVDVQEKPIIEKIVLFEKK